MKEVIDLLGLHGMTTRQVIRKIHTDSEIQNTLIDNLGVEGINDKVGKIIEEYIVTSGLKEKLNERLGMPIESYIINKLEKGKQRTINRFQNDITKDKIKKHFEKKINSQELIEGAKIYLLNRFSGKNPKTYKVQTSFTRDKNTLGIHHPLYNAISIKIFSLGVDYTIMHELSHLLHKSFVDRSEFYKYISGIKFDNILKEGTDKQKKKFADESEYVTDIEEIYARIMEIRYYFKMNPGDEFTKNQFDIIKNGKQLPGNNLLSRINDDTSISNFIELMNKTP